MTLRTISQASLLVLGSSIVTLVACGPSSSSPGASTGDADGGSGVTADGATSGADGGATAADPLGCDGTLSVDSALQFPAGVDSDLLFPVPGGYAAFSNGAQGFELTRFDESFAKASPAVTLAGGTPSVVLAPDGTGFLAVMADVGVASRISTFDDHGAPTWSVDSTVQKMVFDGPGSLRVDAALVSSPDTILFPYANGGWLIPRTATSLPAKIYFSFSVDDMCDSPLPSTLAYWDGSQFEGLYCNATSRVAISTSGETTTTPLTFPAAPDPSPCRTDLGTWRSGSSSVLAAAFYGEDATLGCANPGGANEPFAVWTTTLADSSTTWSAWTRAVAFDSIDPRTIGASHDTGGIVAWAKVPSGGFEVRRATLDGKPRGGPLSYHPPSGADWLNLVPVRGGYLAVTMTESGDVIARDRLRCH